MSIAFSNEAFIDSAAKSHSWSWTHAHEALHIACEELVLRPLGKEAAGFAFEKPQIWLLFSCPLS